MTGIPSYTRVHVLGETWIMAEETAYSADIGHGINLKRSERKGLVRMPDGALRKVTLGVADTFSTIPARTSDGRSGHVFTRTPNGEFDREGAEYVFTYYRWTPTTVGEEVFGDAWAALPAAHRRRVWRDIREIQEEDTATYGEYTAMDAAVILRERIGGSDQLAGYAQCLMVGEK